MGKLRVSLFLLLASALLADDPRLIIDSGGHQEAIRFLAFTRGKSLVSAGVDKVVRIWDIASGKTTRTIWGQSSDGCQRPNLCGGALAR
jgi:WD40 repeat protein